MVNISIEENESQLNLILDNVSDIIFAISVEPDDQFRFKSINQRFLDATGLKPEQIIGALAKDVIPQSAHELVFGKYREAIRTGRPVSWEEESDYPTGSKTGHVTIVPIIDSNGVCRQLVGMVHDITEQKHNEEAILQSEEQIRLLLNSTGEAIYGINLQGCCTFANPSCVRMLGYTNQEMLLGKNMHDLIHHSYSDGTSMPSEVCRIFMAFRKGEKVHVDDEVLWKADGSNFPAEYWSYPQISNGEVRGAVVAFIDITDRKRVEKALRESETRLRFALEGANDGIWDVDMKTNAVYISPRGCEILGYRPDEISEVARVWKELVCPDDLPDTENKLNAYLEGREPVFMVEQRLRSKSSGWIWVLTRGKVAERDALGNPLRMTGTHTDISERKKAETELRISENRFRAFFEHAGIGVIEVESTTGRLLRVNPKFAEITGRSIEDLLSGNYLALTHPDDIENSVQMVQSLMDGKIPDYSFEKRYLRPDGRTIWARITVTPLWAPGEEPSRHLTVVEDITDRRNAENEIRASADRFRSLFEASPFPIVITRLMDGLLMSANQAALKAFRADVSIIGNLRLSEQFVHTEERNRMIEDVTREGFVENRLLRLRDFGGREVDYTASLRLTEWEGTKAIVTGFMDITQRLVMEEKLKEVNELLEARVQEEVEKSQRKDAMLLHQARYAAMGEMLRNIAHQWRQPLNGVGLVIQNIYTKYEAGLLTDESLQHSIKKAMSLVQFMSQTIEDFRELSRSERFLERFDIREVLLNAVSMVSEIFESLSIDFITDLPVAIFVSGYPNEIHQVMQNLFKNSIDAFEEHPRKDAQVVLSLAESEKDAIVRFADNAGGIPATILGRIFDPYFTTREKGSGIGLYLCHMIVEEKMKGNIIAENTTDGATFIIRIPKEFPV